MIRTSILLLTFSVAVVSGCRKRSQPAPPSPEPSSTESAPATTTAALAASAAKAPAVAPPATPLPGAEKIEDRLPTAPPNSSKSNPVDQKLTEALHRYNESTGKMPMDFHVLVAGKYIPAIPTPPAGKRYAIDRPNMQVVLISQ